MGSCTSWSKGQRRITTVDDSQWVANRSFGASFVSAYLSISAEGLSLHRCNLYQFCDQLETGLEFFDNALVGGPRGHSLWEAVILEAKRMEKRTTLGD